MREVIYDSISIAVSVFIAAAMVSIITMVLLYGNKINAAVSNDMYSSRVLTERAKYNQFDNTDITVDDMMQLLNSIDIEKQTLQVAINGTCYNYGNGLKDRGAKMTSYDDFFKILQQNTTKNYRINLVYDANDWQFLGDKFVNKTPKEKVTENDVTGFIVFYEK